MARFRTILVFISLFFIVPFVNAGMAPKDAPQLPAGFCPKATGTITATTGECICRWEHRDACVGSGCMYQMGLSWYHYSCTDCKCIAEP
ncbi:hypothetical protein FisN_11Hh073 [Fistulifera solaris]|uniref:Uncharacterized protein n=1 Tax=Fistulifera solaris TaxID=1519565 RepID=A0A1Z5JKM7_FISSO|nr:hypothetical protein FisN_11Hh073 [Fistulifera solaris]|eukprot:GAX14466.1 hypothetical protein FisN_11Hh073 [Fistulifera solaris]